MELATLALIYVYVFLGFSFATIADRTGTSGTWMAFVPPFQGFLLLRLAARPLTWVLGLVVPGLNLLTIAALLGDIAASRGLPRTLGVLTVAVPTGVGLVLLATHQPVLVLTLGASAASLCVYAGLVAYAR